MSKFCENCGAEMDDNQVVCPNCGNGAEEVKAEEVTVEETVNTTETKTAENKSAMSSENLKKYGIIGGIALAVIVVLTILINILTSGWKAPIKNYLKGMQKADVKTYEKAYPDFINERRDLDKDDMESILDSLEDEYGEKIKISYKITKSEKIKKDDLKKVQEYVEEKYEEDVKISAGKEVKVKMTVKGKDDSETDTKKMYIYKIDGKWKMLDVSPSSAKEYLKYNK